jgi:hypothetical protein
MKKYNLQKDLKNIIRVFFSTLSIITLFVIFALALLLPIFLVSKYYPKTYSLIITSLILLIILILIIKKLITIWKKYKKIDFFVYHILINFFAPIITFFILIIIESVFLRIFYKILPFIYSTILIVVINLFIIFLLFLLRRIIHNFKLYLKENQIKEIT